MRKYFKFLILLTLAVLILWWFGRGLDWVSVRQSMARADRLYLAVAVLIVCLSYLVRAWRWQALLRPLCPAGLGALFAATTVGFGAVFLLGRAGEVLRPAFLPLRDRRVGPGAAFITIGVERIYDLTAVVILFAANLLWFRPPATDPAAYARVRTAGFMLLAGAALGIAALVVFQRFHRQIIDWLDGHLASARAPLKKVGQFILGLSKQLAQALGVLVDFRDLAVTVGWTCVLWGSVAAANWLILRAFGLPFGLSTAIFLMGWALVGSLVPTPGGGAGAFHAATAAGLVFLGVRVEEAAAVAIVMHLVVFAPAAFFGIYYFLRSDVSIARLRGLIFQGEKEAEALDANASPEHLPRTGVAEG